MAHETMKNRLLSFSLIALMASPLLDQNAEARAGRGYSLGSRGSQTWSVPSQTSLSRWSRPMDRSITPPSSAPSGGGNVMGGGFGSAIGAGAAGGLFARRPPAFGASSSSMAGSMAAARPSFAARHPFLTGFAGGMLGAGLLGMLSGHGFMAGIHGFFSFIGFLIQVGIVILLIRFVLGWFRKKSSSKEGSSQSFAKMNSPMGGSPFSQKQQNEKITLSAEDYRAFQDLLVNVQAAWSAQNIPALQRLATPEMVGYFSEQLSDLTSRGARNIISNLQFENGELSEAWREGNLSYATVAMRYSMIDVTTDSFGNVIDGSKTERQTVTELWTFLRSEGRANWILSAIQQAG